MLRECSFVSNGEKTFVCERPRCKRVVVTRSPYKFEPSDLHFTCNDRRRGLGDFIASVLQKIGITKESWETRPVVCGGFFGTWQRLEQNNPCGCKVRQDALNRCGWRWEGRVNAAGWWIWYRLVWLKEAATKVLFRCCQKDD